MPRPPSRGNPWRAECEESRSKETAASALPRDEAIHMAGPAPRLSSSPHSLWGHRPPLSGSQSHYVCESLGRVRLLATPWTVARQATLSMEFSRQKYWRGHFFLQGSFPTQGSNLGLLHCRQILYCLSQQRSPSIEEAVIIPTSGGCQNDK